MRHLARLAVVLAALGPAGCQPRGTPPLAATTPMPGRCEVPVAERTEEIGCYLSATVDLGDLPTEPVFWHIDQFESRPAAEAQRTARGVVVEAYGRVLLYTVGASPWRPSGGRRLATVGPLPHAPGVPYVARYMEGTTEPGMLTRAHRHSGAEAFHVLEGGLCLETPDSVYALRAGESAVIPAGPPMVLRHMGAQRRRSVLVVLHPRGEPWMSQVPGWAPAGHCPR